MNNMPHWSPGNLITATKLNQGTIGKFESIVALEGVDTSLFTDAKLALVENVGVYLFDPASAVTADGYMTLNPVSGTGRWHFQFGGNIWQDVTGSTVMTNGGKYVSKSATRVPFQFPNSAAIGAEFEIVNEGSGGFRINISVGQTIHAGNAIYVPGQVALSNKTYASARILCTAANQFTFLNYADLLFQTIGAGYLLGGQSNSGFTYIGTIFKLSYSTDALSTLAATLDVPREMVGGGQSATKGYCFLGYNGSSIYRVTEDVNFSTDTSTLLAATPTTYNFNDAQINSTVATYLCAGPIEKFTHSTETFANTAMTPTPSRSYVMGADNITVGYWGGDNTYSRAIDKVTFASDTIAAISALMSVWQSRAAGTSQLGVAGYFIAGRIGSGGGSTGTAISKLAYPSETTSTLAATVASERQNSGALSSAVKGYASGGVNGGGSYLNSTVDLTFATETSATLAATLSSGIRSQAGASNRG